MEYIELHARSAFSFLRGAATPEELIAVCSELKMPAMALLDTDGVYGAARFHLAGKKLKVKAHIGAELTVSSLKSQVSSLKSQPRRQSPEFQIPKQLITLPLLVRNRTGYQNLCRLITLMKLRVPKHSKPGECAVTWDELAEYAEGLVCLTGKNDGPIAGNIHHRDTGIAQRTTEKLIDIFGKENIYAELQRHFNREEEARNHAIIEIARRLKLPVLATNGVCDATRAPRQVADLFPCLPKHGHI